MAGGSSGGADIDGRAFDAGPEAQNESAASIGESAGLSGQAAKDYGIAQMDALDAQHGTNFGQRARGLTGNNSIGTAELDSYGFDADAPAGLQHAHQQAAFEQALYDPSTMMAQNALQSLSLEFMQNPLGIIDPDEAHIAYPSTETGYSPTFGYFKFGGQHVGKHDTGLLGLGKTIQVGLRDRPLYGPNAYPVAVHGYDPGLGPHYEGPVREVDFRDDFGSTSSGFLSQGGIPNSGFLPGPDATLYGDHIGPNNIGHGVRVGPFGYGYLDLDVDPDATWDDAGWNVNPVDVQSLGSFDFGLDSAPMSYDQSAAFDRQAISGAGGDPRLAEARRLASQRAMNQIISGIDFTPDEVEIMTNPPPGGGETTGGETPPGSSTTPPPGTIYTPPVDDNVVDDPGEGNIPTPPSVKKRRAVRKKIRTAAKTYQKPKAFKRLPKFAQKELRRGITPTTGSDHVQDMVRAFLAPPATPLRGADQR